MRRIPCAKPARRKASPGGEAGSPLGLTDEVEAKNYRQRKVQRCYLRPHPVRLKPDHHSRGMTATGSHIDFGFAARSTTLQGKAFLCFERLLRRFSPLRQWQSDGRGMPRPYIQNRTAYRPSSGRFAATFPQGKALPTFCFLGKQPMSRNRLTPSFSGTPCPAARR